VARAMATGFEAAARLRGSRARPLLTRTAIDMVTARSRTSTRKIQEDLGFEPRYGVASAMAELQEWFSTERRTPASSGARP